MIFYDFEVFKYNWLVVLVDTDAKEETVIVDDRDKMTDFYNEHKYDIWVGYNSRHYDQYILKTILCGLNPKECNDHIIVKGGEGWQFSKLLRDFPLNNYDVMPNPPVGLKTLEGFLGSNIKETDVDFNIDRKLTDSEIAQTIEYCRHDVEQTIEVFLERKSEFEAQFNLVKLFDLPLNMIGYTEARITAQILGCQKTDFNDEYEYYFLPCIELKKYKYVMDWFESAVKDNTKEMNERFLKSKSNRDDASDPFWFKLSFYKRKLETTVAGIPHTFGFGGLHGATAKPIHTKGLILHVDVGSYYPSMLLAWGLVTRASTNDNYKLVYDTRMKLKHEGKKKEQAPYKKLLNALSGAMKDETNPAYDPRNNNIMCINGQLMLLDLIEHLEVVPGFQLIQSNTDGLIIQIPDTDEAFYQVDDICFDWEKRCSTKICSILLELDTIAEIYQKDVNNYLWIDANGKVERKGAYVKQLSRIDNDLPILNTALVNFMVDHVPVERTINGCDDVIQFQKVVKLSDKYKWVEHERLDGNNEEYTYKSYRVFASKDPNDGRLLKCGGSRGKPEKFANTPDHCFILNDSVNGCTVPDTLDRNWYIELAKKRLKDFGL